MTINLYNSGFSSAPMDIVSSISANEKEFLDAFKEINLTLKKFNKLKYAKGFEHFNRFCLISKNIQQFANAENKIYKKMWEVKKRPRTNPLSDIGRRNFGKKAFNEIKQTTLFKEKKDALESYLISFVKNELKEIAKKFRNANADIARKEFEIIFRLSSDFIILNNIQNIVYKKMAKIIESIIMIDDSAAARKNVGQFVFDDLDNSSSSLMMKAEAIEACVRELEHQKFDADDLENRVESYYRLKGPFIPVDTSQIIPQCMTDLLDKLFTVYGRICFSEHHSDPFAKEIISFCLERYNITDLFMEHFAEHLQDDLDIFCKGGPLSAPLDENLIIMDRYIDLLYPNTCRAILYKARERGTRVIGIDTEEANEDDGAKRCKLMNYVAARIIKWEKRNGLSMCLIGSAHLANQDRNLPGVSELIGWPSVCISPDRSILDIKSNTVILLADSKKMVVNFCFSKSAF